MKIAFIVSEFPSLSQTFVLNQITGLIDRGHEVSIFSRREGKDVKVHDDVIKYGLIKCTHYFPKLPQSRVFRVINGVKLFLKYLPGNVKAILNALNIDKHGKLSASLSLLFQTIPFLKDNKFDIVHCHFGINGNIATVLRDAGVISGKIVTVFHGYDLTSYLEKNDPQIYQKLFLKGDLFQPISNRWERKLIELGCSRNKIEVHRMGIDLDKIKTIKKETYHDRCLRILSVARLVDKKGLAYGIKAFSKVIENFRDIEYLIIGGGPLKDELQSLINRLGLNENVKLVGEMKQEEIFDNMNRSDIFLAPSVTSKTGDQEGIPVVIMEAMAHELPVVSTYHSGIPELVIDNKTGFLVDERDVKGLAEKIIFLISNPDVLARFGAEGRKIVAAKYNIQTLNDDLAKCFRKLSQQ